MGAKPSRRPNGPSVHERDFVDFTKSGDPLESLLERRLAQEQHALLLRRALDLRGRTPRQDELANVVREIEQLGDRETAVETGAVALDASLALVEGEVGVDPGIEAALLEQLARGLGRTPAMQADLAHQALRQDAVERRDEIIE